MNMIAISELDFDGHHILAAYDKAHSPQPSEVA
jgi:hypothetical protein